MPDRTCAYSTHHSFVVSGQTSGGPPARLEWRQEKCSLTRIVGSHTQKDGVTTISQAASQVEKRGVCVQRYPNGRECPGCQPQIWSQGINKQFLGRAPRLHSTHPGHPSSTQRNHLPRRVGGQRSILAAEGKLPVVESQVDRFDDSCRTHRGETKVAVGSWSAVRQQCKTPKGRPGNLSRDCKLQVLIPRLLCLKARKSPLLCKRSHILLVWHLFDCFCGWEDLPGGDSAVGPSSSACSKTTFEDDGTCVSWQHRDELHGTADPGLTRCPSSVRVNEFERAGETEITSLDNLHVASHKNGKKVRGSGVGLGVNIFATHKTHFRSPTSNQCPCRRKHI